MKNKYRRLSNTAQTTRPATPSQSAKPASTLDTMVHMALDQHFQGTMGEPAVPHMTVHGFLQQIEHRWNLEDIRRFGTKVGQMAESMHVSYRATQDRSLDTVRCFPIPMLEWVYTSLHVQNQWPPLPEGESPAAEAARLRHQIRTNEKAAARLRELIETNDNVDILESLAKSLAILEADTERLSIGGARSAHPHSSPAPAGNASAHA